ncbi:Afp14-like protein [Cardinium endosymbiont of Sogatella furcifera]|uniref:contractile injection system tape measure protein n=1 Tax=Cardinium endosymbiont of Sogatella furcifera TaxID=650378 RepID=UPI000E0DAE9A|nr:contractile injection system tape measure protein [Cardinium endosymbiont of Sogatella furcifera]AXI23926.1 Afp14-like protein [Cardinium endosymbiont of Sogatella furcifera]
MPTKNHHVILRSRIEVTIDQHSQNSMLYHTVQQAVQKRIIPILSKLFAQYVPSDVVIHLDKLVIDGGDVYLSTLDKQLPCQVEQVLMLKLQEQMRKVIHNPTAVIPLPEAKRQAIAHYLSEGHLAWWMIERSEKQIEKIYLELLHYTPLLIEQLWYDLHKKEKAVQRCMTFFARSTVERTLSCLLKQPIAYFKPILTEIGILLQQKRVATNLLDTKQLFATTLLSIINQPRGKVDRMGFLRMLLKQVALQTSTSYEKMLEALQIYYAQNEKKPSFDSTTKALVLQLRDLAITPLKFGYESIKNKEQIVKELDKIANNGMAPHQLSAAIGSMKRAMDRTGIRPLVKSWLQEAKNREKLVQNLPDRLFVACLASIDPSIVGIFSDCMQIATATTAATTPACAIKAMTLAYCAFEHSKTFYLEEMHALFRTHMANGVISPQQCAKLLTTQTYNPAIKAIIAPLVSISTLSSEMPKETTCLWPVMPDANNKAAMQPPIIQHSLPASIPLSMEWLPKLETVLIAFLESTECQANIDHLKNMFITAAVDAPSTRQYIGRVIGYLAPYTSLSADALCDRLSDIAEQKAYPDLAACLARVSPKVDQESYIVQTYSTSKPVDASQTKQHTTRLDGTHNHPLADVVDFLVDNVLPNDQLVPAYFIAKCLERATPKQIRDQLAPWCQEATILKKLMQHATEITVAKLLQAFVPCSHQMLDRLERVMMQVLQRTQQQGHIRSIKEIFIAAAIRETPPEKQYIERIVFHLSAQTASPPTRLCDALIDAAREETDYQLVEIFSFLKEKLTPLKLTKIDEVDLMFLSTHETLDQALVPLYYSRLLPAIKEMVRQSVELSPSIIDQLVAQHLPNLPLQETMRITLYKQIADVILGKKKRIIERWHLFLHTGKLGNYTDATALLSDVLTHLSTFSLAQDKAHVRQRLIANFTHTQLMQLIQRHSAIGKTLTTFIQGSYQWWCDTQGALGEQNMTKNLFWDGVLKTLPQTSIAPDDWLADLTTELSNVLEVTPTTLLTTFQLLDTKEIPETLTASLNRLQEKYSQVFQQQARQRGYHAPILIKLYLLLNGNLSLFAQQYHLTIERLGDELIQFMEDQPLELPKLLADQDNHQVTARRIVHYFSEEVTTKIITCLAKDNAPFVMHYLTLLNHPLLDTTIPFHHPSTWKKELCISIMHYLISKKSFAAQEFVHSTLLTTCYTQGTIYKIITSIVDTKATNQEADQLITLLKPLIKHMHPSQSALVHQSLEKAPLKTSPQKVRLPEASVQVYTKNTGLVFLWPFLYDFFKLNNLMVDDQFFCDQAAHNAVYLLQYLVTGKLKSPEWQLTLPKLLCGLSYDAVLLPYKPIDETEDIYDQVEEKGTTSDQQLQASQDGTTSKIEIETETSTSSNTMAILSANSQLLMEKVLKRWKSITKLQETDAFQNATLERIVKDYFLNRLGILTSHQADDTTEKKFWHLTMMHQDHDTGDLLPPWSMNKLKLPWMQEEIILFWIPE